MMRSLATLRLHSSAVFSISCLMILVLVVVLVHDMNVNNMNNVLVVAFNTAGISSLNHRHHHRTTSTGTTGTTGTSTGTTGNNKRYHDHRTRKEEAAFILMSATSSSSSSSNEQEIEEGVSSPQSSINNTSSTSTTINRSATADDTGDTTNNNTNDTEESSTKQEEEIQIPSSSSKKEISVSASIVLPFQADIAFSAFADLPRQPTWSNWLHSVDYIDNNDDDNNDIKQTNIPEMDGIPDTTPRKKWVMQWKKAFRFSWNSRVTNIVRPSLIEWESTSGLQNMGKIEFTERNGNDEKNGNENENEYENGTDGVTTDMVLTMKFIAPRIVASMMRRSDAISTLMEEKMLMPTLTNFRQIVMEQDLGMDMDMDMDMTIEEFEV